MIEIRTILCPVDLSETSGRALGYATMLAGWYGASVSVVEMVWEALPPLRPASAPRAVTPQFVKEAASELREFVETRIPAGTTVASQVVEGPIVPGILQEARAQAVELIVMGTHGRGGFERLVLGSVTEKVLRKAPCPVLTVPPGAAGAPPTPRPFGRILCPVDFSPSSLRALTHALSLAQESGKQLTMLHVFDWPADRPMVPGLGPEVSATRRQSEAAALAELRAAVPDGARDWCEITEMTSVGRPYEEILRVADTVRADVIVLGVHSRSTFELALLGSTTSQVVRRATCPVMTIRP
jgi:nucleotide-binding universal stress UspA family protein